MQFPSLFYVRIIFEFQHTTPRNKHIMKCKLFSYYILYNTLQTKQYMQGISIEKTLQVEVEVEQSWQQKMRQPQINRVLEHITDYKVWSRFHYHTLIRAALKSTSWRTAVHAKIFLKASEKVNLNQQACRFFGVFFIRFLLRLHTLVSSIVVDHSYCKNKETKNAAFRLG